MIDHGDKDRDNLINFKEFKAVVLRDYPNVWDFRN